MMNQHNPISGRTGCFGRQVRYPDQFERASYRDSATRGAYPFGRAGCGCGTAGMGRACARPRPSGASCGCNESLKHPVDRPVSPCPSPAKTPCGEPAAAQAGAACQKLTEQIRAVDFALYEVILYLDVYPDACDALETYHKLLAQRKALHAEYEAAVGPITAFGNQSTTHWDWMKKPFPWEYNAD